MKGKKSKLIIGAVAIAVIGVVAVVLFTGKKEVSYHTANVGKGTVEITVMATGYIQPVEEVEVGTQVSGVIEKIYVDYNSHVKKGQLLAQLETVTLKETVNKAKATLRASQSDLDYARQNYNRTKKLYESKATTEVSFEDATNKLNQAETTHTNAKVALNQAEIDLSYAYIYSPIDGVVLERAVNIGQTVAAAFTTPTLFTIAEDLTKMQVEVNVDEADIGQVRTGQQVSFTVDSYPGEKFTGTVSEIRLQPTVKSNVVTYTVIVEAPNPDEKLFPGMTASTTIMVASEKGMTIPVEAVNFVLTTELAENLGISESPTSNEVGVWVKSGDKIERRKISTGLDDGIYYIVESGLSDGEEVVLSATLGKKQLPKKKDSAMPSPPMGGGGRAAAANGVM